MDTTVFDYMRVLQKFVIEKLSEGKGMTPADVRTLTVMVFHMGEKLENLYSSPVDAKSQLKNDPKNT